MKDEQIIQEELESIRQELIQRHHQLNMKASGQWADSLRVQVNGTKGKLIGKDYTYYMQIGRRPGRMPPLEAIEQWIINKGLKPIEDKIKTSSLAFLIARKIKEEGTKYYQQGGTDLIDSVVTPQRIQKIIDRVGQLKVVELKSQILEIVQKIKNESQSST